MAQEVVTLEKQGEIAIVTINHTKKLNALGREGYYQLSTLLQDVAKMADIAITVVTGTGSFFSAGADVTASQPSKEGSQNAQETRKDMLMQFVSNNLDVTRAFYTHPKILVVALNGPAVGLSAALVAFADFIYATPHSYLLTPFSSLGLVAEGGASIAFVQRLGISKANEALIMSKRISSEDLVQTGFVNKIFAGQDKNDDKGFLRQVLTEVKDRLGPHLNRTSLVEIKALIRRPYMDMYEAQNAREVAMGLERLMTGEPREEFRKIAARQKRHKL